MKMRTRVRTFLVGGGLGAAAAYFFDPSLGRSRRTQARDRMGALVRTAGRKGERVARRTGAEGYGMWQRATHPRPEDREPDDRKLADRVRSELLGRGDIPKGHVVVDVENGVVVLRGQVEQPDQVGEIEAATRSISGVGEVANLLHTGSTPAPNKQEALEASRAGRGA
jgi:osmotically-inducible protein OsmY